MTDTNHATSTAHSSPIQTEDDQLGGIRHNAATPCPSGQPYPHTYTTHCRSTGSAIRTRPTRATTNTLALEAAEARAGIYRLAYDHLATTTRNLMIAAAGAYDGFEAAHDLADAVTKAGAALRRDITSYLNEKPADHCRCTWLGIDTPEHPRNSLCLPDRNIPADETPQQTIAYLRQQLEDERASHQKTIANFTEFADMIAEERAVSSVPPARTQEPAVPHQDWGPYESDLQVRLAPMPVAVNELHDAGLIRSGDPEGLVSNVVLAHLVAACESARIRRGAYDDRILEWLTRGETTTAQVVIGLIRRAYAAGATAASD
jgi:hypothetical protein